MNHKSLINQLQLAHEPLTAFEFAKAKNDTWLEKVLECASLYLIAQRPVITFENVTPDKVHYQLNFEIHQKDNPNVLKCALPFEQNELGLVKEDVYFGINFLDRTHKQNTEPFKNVRGFTIGKHHDGKREKGIWFSPEKLLRNCWSENIDCEVLGDWRSFTRYKIHYVGKATKQSILQRLTGHSTFQDILSLETPVTEKQLPANEIVILPFGFQDNFTIHSFGEFAKTEDMVSAANGEDFPNLETVYLDAEKALINAMQPQYNKELFKRYPFSKDGLYSHNYNLISYTFVDPITLLYETGEIRGGLSPIGGDEIVIVDNSNFYLEKHD